MFDRFISSMSWRMDSSEMTWPVDGIVLVTVDALEQDGDPVDKELTVLDLGGPEADPRGDRLDRLSRAVQELEDETVEGRRLGAPPGDAGQARVEPDDGPAVRRRGRRPLRPQDLPARGVEKRQGHRGGDRSGGGRLAEIDRHRQPPVPVPVIQAGPDLEVADTDPGRGVEIDVALDAGQPPEVLAFEIGAVRPPVDLGGQDVLAGLEEFGDVPFGRRLRILAEAELLSVDPDVEERLDGAELEIDVHSGPVRRDRERPAVGADRIAVVGHEGRLGVPGEFVRDVNVDRDIVALEHPVRGDGSFRPAADVGRRLPELEGPVAGPRRPVELPWAVEGHGPRRLLRVRA